MVALSMPLGFAFSISGMLRTISSNNCPVPGLPSTAGEPLLPATSLAEKAEDCVVTVMVKLLPFHPNAKRW